MTNLDEDLTQMIKEFSFGKKKISRGNLGTKPLEGRTIGGEVVGKEKNSRCTVYVKEFIFVLGRKLFNDMHSFTSQTPLNDALKLIFRRLSTSST